MEKNTKEIAKLHKARKRKKKNVKIFPLYRMISWDLLFYYPIIFLFLTQIKHLSASQVLFADAFYLFANTFWQIFIGRFVYKIGKKNSLIVGNVLYAFSIFAMIFMKSFQELIAIQFIYALGYSIKAMCETNLLYESLPSHPKKRGKLFSKIEAKAYSNFFYFDALSSALAGYMFTINGYLPMIFCFTLCVISIIISICFKETNLSKDKTKHVSIKEYISQLKDSMTFFKKSKRIKYLLIYNAIIYGMIFGIVNLRSSMLSDMHIPESYFGIIFALLQISAGISSRYQDKIHKIFRNRTLTVIALPVTFSCILIGFVGKDALSLSSLILIILLYLIQNISKGPYFGLISRYLNNFTNRTIRPKISALKNLTGNLFSATVAFICSILVQHSTTANTFIIIGCISSVGMIIILDKMRTTVGIKPEYLTKEDIRYSTNKPKLKEKVRK